MLSIVSSWNTVNEKQRARNDGIKALMTKNRLPQYLRMSLRKWAVRLRTCCARCVAVHVVHLVLLWEVLASGCR